MKTEAIIFDLGNVLVFHDNAKLIRAFAERAVVRPELVAQHLEGPFWDKVHRGQVSSEALRHTVCQALRIELSAAEFYELWNSHFTVNDELIPLVETLIGRTKLLLLSNTNELHAHFIKSVLPILNRFDHLLFSHELGMMKPEPEIFRYALRCAGTAPEATAFVDDIPSYVEAASKLGLKGLVFRNAKEFAAQLRMLEL